MTADPRVRPARGPGRKNIIVLTGGISGSSVLSGLVARAGYWLGTATVKTTYETFENSRLVELNRQILAAAGFTWEDILDLPPPDIERIKAVVHTLDRTRFLQFIETCNDHGPWLWKDPRLCYTIWFWQALLDLADCQFIFMTRDAEWAWTGMVVRGKVCVGHRDYVAIHRQAATAATRFLEEHQLPYHRLEFEELIGNPEAALSGLNGFLGGQFSVDDLADVYHAPLRKARWTRRHQLLARVRLLVCGALRRRRLSFPRRP